MNFRNISYGRHAMRLEQNDSKVHFPSTVGLTIGEWLYKISDPNNAYKCIKHLPHHKTSKFNKIVDIGCGPGHLAILASKLFPQCNNFYGVDLLSESIEHLKHNWKLNVSSLSINRYPNQTRRLHTLTGDINDVFKQMISDKNNNYNFDLIICNPPNIGFSSGNNDVFFTTGNNGRYMLDSLLINCRKLIDSCNCNYNCNCNCNSDISERDLDCINRSRHTCYILTTDTTLNGWNETNKLLNKYYGKENENWWVLDIVNMDIPFLNQVKDNYKLSIKKEWKQWMLDNKRLLIDDNTKQYYQLRRYLLIHATPNSYTNLKSKL